MVNLEIKIPTSSKTFLKMAGRAFISMIIVILASLAWQALRNDCDVFQSGKVLVWIQALVSWFVLSMVLAMALPKNMMFMLIYSFIIGLLATCVVTHCDYDEKLGEYLLDILQSISISMAAGAGMYSLSKMLKWH